MSPPYLPAEPIVEMFRRLRQKAGTDALTELTNYMYTPGLQTVFGLPILEVSIYLYY